VPLLEAERLKIMSYRQAVNWADASKERLRFVARARGYKQGWVWHRLQELQRAW
jgi:hypothetical protein